MPMTPTELRTLIHTHERIADLCRRQGETNGVTYATAVARAARKELEEVTNAASDHLR